MTLFFSFFTTLEGKEVVVELKNDVALRGILQSVDQYLNIKLDNVSVVDADAYPQLVRRVLSTQKVVLAELRCARFPWSAGVYMLRSSAPAPPVYALIARRRPPSPPPRYATPPWSRSLTTPPPALPAARIAALAEELLHPRLGGAICAGPCGCGRHGLSPGCCPA